MKTFLTGLQPSGKLHIGNYFGSIKPNLDLAQKAEKSIIFLADLHTLTSLKDAKKLKDYTFDMALSLLACGLDPQKTIMFRQSRVPAHSELAWILSTIAPMGLLERAHAYKDKTSRGLEANVGLFTYPVLMAADILLYGPEAVPVGKDQKQHVEIARDLAQKFHHEFSCEIFTIPEPVIAEETGVVPGIDGQKMSKSYGNTIPLFGSPKEIKKCVLQIVTDSTPVEDPKNPETCNVFALCKLFMNASELLELEKKYRAGGMGYGEAKNILFEKLEAYFSPIWKKREELEKNPEMVLRVLEESEKMANEIANRTLQKVWKKVGL